MLDKHAAAGGVAIASARLAGPAGRAALVAEWQRGSVESVALRRSGNGYASGRAAVFLSGFVHPLPLATTAAGALLVGDWATGKVYRIARV